MTERFDTDMGDTGGYTAEQLLKALEAVRFISAENLKTGDTVKDYCQKRGIPMEILKELGFGSIPSPKILTEKMKAMGADSGCLQVLGLLNGSRTSVLTNRLTIPIMDRTGRVVAFSGRALKDDVKPKYLNTSTSPVFEKRKILYGLDRCIKTAKDNDLILVEGFMDVVGARMVGVQNCAATMGTSLTEEQTALIRDLGCTVTMVYDNDDAGRLGMCRAVRLLTKQGVPVSVISLSDLDRQFVKDETLAHKDLMDYARLGVKAGDLAKIREPGLTFLFRESYFRTAVQDSRQFCSILQAAREDLRLSGSRAAFLDVAVRNSPFTQDQILRLCRNETLDLSGKTEKAANHKKDLVLKEQDIVRWYMQQAVEKGPETCRKILGQLEQTLSQERSHTWDRDMDHDH
ncbi:toprim domain-containing protein [Faecalibaculum rodentium]|uniref:toprim domain-containing protein n=1 Tax=Faecalibaculum rodentium TaxID=1702221 RepID=UPI0023F35D6C|nr:toprim domain-containing protein [Faecalibaculum rodentium]